MCTCSPGYKCKSHRTIEKLLIDAEHLLRAAHRDYGLWSDGIRQGAERRQGVGAGDERALDDPVYDRALKLYSRLDALANATTEALTEQQYITKANEGA